MNILLHICCAPCSIYPIAKLRDDKHVVAGFFYNPNIHPYSEYLKRKEAAEKYSGSVDFNVMYPEYELDDYFSQVAYDGDIAGRCAACWWVRIKKCAKRAKENDFDAFTTTLLGSPYQDHEALKAICEDTARSAGIKFYYEDFRIGFKKAQDVARAKGIYMQNYCGCLFSEKEKIEKKAGKK